MPKNFDLNHSLHNYLLLLLKFNMRFILIVLITLIFNLGLTQERRVITTAVPFLMIASDARAAGVGEQGVATSTDNFSQHWNPSKYVFSEFSSGVSFSYTPYLSKLVNDIFLANISYYNKLDERSSWSASLKYFSLGDIDILQNPLDIPIIENPNEFTLDAAYSLKLNENFALAVTGRFLLSDVKLQTFDSETEAASSFAVDISGYYESDISSYKNFDGIFRGGFNFSNIGPKMKYSKLNNGTESFLPTNLRLGTGFEFIFDSNNSIAITLEINKLLVPSPSQEVLNSSGDIVAYRQPDIGFLQGIFKSFGDAPDGFSEELNELTYSLGLEYSFNKSFYLRSGYFSEHELKGSRKFITIGSGFNTSNNLKIDLSYLISTSDVISPLENTVRLSLGFNFQ
tara:strand:+ start:2985 stop:4181 length:1197 start_codon:yes stop_codon:yes gene_type:complete